MDTMRGNRFDNDYDVQELLYEMEAVYRQSEEDFFLSNDFAEYEDLYAELSEKVEEYDAEIFIDMIPLLEEWDFKGARDLFRKEESIQDLLED